MWLMTIILVGAFLSPAQAQSSEPAATVPTSSANAVTPTTAPAPAPGDQLHIQFTGSLTIPTSANAVDIDADEAKKSQVRRIRASGRSAICYVSAGSLERYRSDANLFPSELVGRKLDGWPRERWLDVRDRKTLRPLLERRVQRCAKKGFTAIEFDNVDGYQNRTGFKINRRHQIKYNKMLSRLAARSELSPGLKNAVGLVKPLSKQFDWALNEECVTYNECSVYRHFRKRNKAVFIIEYGDRPKSVVCREAQRIGATAQIKRLQLDAWARHC